MLLSNNQCVKLCPETTFNKDGICLSCPDFCSLCPNENTCTRCQLPRILQLDFLCGAETCPDTTIPINEKCVKCLTEDSCRICDPKDLKKCVECKNAWPMLDNKCVETCPDKTFEEQRVCKKCTDKCLKCSNALTCNTCEAGFSLQTNGKCLSSCPKGSYSADGVCLPCEDRCEVCDSTRCMKCATTVFLQNGKCVASCAVGSFPSKSKECLNCSSNCNQCTAAITCKVCAPGFYLKNGMCVESCGSGFALNTTTGICVACGFGCDTCNAMTPKVCIRCKNPLVVNLGQCTDVCPRGSYRDDNFVCQKCILNCDICADTTSCITCKVDFFLHPNGASCSKTRFCGEGFRLENNLCIPCAVNGCKGCTTSSSTCTECYQPLLRIDNIACVNSCPEGRYRLNLTCAKCPTACKTCDDLNNCSSCIDGMVLNKNKCVSKCDSGQTAVSGVCQDCQVTSCRSCDTSLTRCLDCNLDRFLLSATRSDGSTATSCVTDCGAGKFPYNRVCTNCMSNCNRCSVTTSCVQCSSGFVLQGLSCQAKCDLGYVEVSGKCVRCTNPNCLVCDSLSLGTCRKCTTGYSIKNNDCVKECGDGFFKYLVDNSYLICMSCPANCKTCTNSTTCSACNLGFILNTGRCV
jgi:proprotein convertase subtilisin/kexin type 5